MSSSASVFVSDVQFGQVVDILTAWLGKPPDEQADDGTVTYEALDVHIFAEASHELEDDQGIPFSNYPCQVCFTRYARSDADPEILRELCRLLARALATKLESHLGCDCLVVEDLQRRIR
jgi:hypothetical protein